MERSDLVGALAAAAFAALVLVAAAQGVGDVGSVPSPDRELAEGPTTVAAAEDLVAAWAETRTMTHRSVGTFSRVGEGGQELRVPTEVVQRAPDRLLRGFQAVSGRRDDRVLSCPAPLDGGAPECSLGPPGASFDQVVADEVAALRRLVTGPDPLYTVAATEPGCWRMTRTRFDPRSGYGQHAELCFDRDSGALVRIEIDHGDVREVTEYTEISLEVDASDLEPYP